MIVLGFDVDKLSIKTLNEAKNIKSYIQTTKSPRTDDYII